MGLIICVIDWMVWLFFWIWFCLLVLVDFEIMLLNEGLKIELLKLKMNILIMSSGVSVKIEEVVISK